MNALHGIIFDLDGTLVDSKLDFPAMRAELGLPAGTGLLEHLASLEDQTQRTQTQAVIERHELQGAQAASWITGAQAALHTLANAGIPMAIVTRNMQSATQQMVKRLGIPIRLIITREDCTHVKPHPEGLLRVANQWQIAPEKLAYLGDYTFDLQAAKRAGMQAWLWRNEHNAAFESEADKVFSEYETLVREFI
ncbi:HAD family hydrolase [Simiduia sp. 21SJ11W-1]|uniref:HAD family hydrolase n=1 Tax=Simiduia sp. 21SJ11W-1 TaxID=2909669 RepID=UPI0020A1C1CB|nr:HAD-IA family hydrolase [Simiduia sp. 21SJ11W-1]UTA46844.1 HAD family hydrolase [Simiduia sp. 21SJ11W-1]